MQAVKIYTTTVCPYCVQAKRLLQSKGVDYEEINVQDDQEMRMKLVEMSGQRTVPQIWVGETHVGGYQELAALERARTLDDLLQG